MYVDVPSGRLDWPQVYRLCIGLVNPRPIALVATISSDGKHNLAPFSFFNLVSANPPALAFCPALRRDRSRKHTLANIEATKQFVVATVTEDIATQMVRCAADLPDGESEFDFSGLTPAPATRVKPPLVKEAKVNLECTLRQVVRLGAGPSGGNTVFGNIVAIHVADEVVGPDGLVDPYKLRSVGRLGGEWYCTVVEPYELKIPKVKRDGS